MAGHETRDIHIRGVLIFGVILVASVLASLLLMKWMFDIFAGIEERAQPPPTSLLRPGTTMAPPEPRLQADPRADLASMRAEEERRLNGYAWVDREAGLASIPVDRAIDLLLEKGLPVREGAPEEPAAAGREAR